MTPEAAIAALEGYIQPGKAADMAAYHKADRPYLGVTNPDIDTLVKYWRREMTVAERAELADDLWRTNIHEARLAAAKLLTQARIKEDEPVWQLIASWVPTFDAWAIADHASIAGQKRLVADPSRLDEVEVWTRSDHMWSRRAALVMTLPWTKQNNPKPEEEAIRDRVLGWAASYVPDKDWFIQKAVAWWVRDLSKHDAERAKAFLEAHGGDMKGFARKEAGRHLR
ncbi:DNA alkylation repair protein [Pseudoruegeria sp. HB172150]|uniref:DNA alkylation repair protein n=1 Tax=Pseudoruegeria sp. HB172150 TaxID=2721164 RepID=UPI00155718D6|nr:DNA alkylation repair protein [Pseudoruegeria sp. HB172150]